MVSFDFSQNQKWITDLYVRGKGSNFSQNKKKISYDLSHNKEKFQIGYGF